MATGQDPSKVFSVPNARGNDIGKHCGRIDYYHKGVGYQLILGALPLSDFTATAQVTVSNPQSNLDAPAAIPQDSIEGSTNKVVSQPKSDSMGQLPDHNDNQRTTSTSLACGRPTNEQTKALKSSPSPNWGAVPSSAPIEQIASYNRNRQRRKPLLYRALCFAVASLVGLAVATALLHNRFSRLNMADIRASSVSLLVRLLSTALLNESSPQPKSPVTTSVAPMPAGELEGGTPRSLDTKTSSRTPPEPPSVPVAASELAKAPVGDAAVPSDAETSPGILSEQPHARGEAEPGAAPPPAEAPLGSVALSSDAETLPGALRAHPITGTLQQPPTSLLGTVANDSPSIEEVTPSPAQRVLKLRVPNAEIDALLSRGDSFLRTGDVTSARLFYEKGAEAGDGTAALRLGETFDPDFLKRAHLVFIRGDAGKALEWYRRAADFGNADAKVLVGNTSVSKN